MNISEIGNRQEGGGLVHNRRSTYGRWDGAFVWNRNRYFAKMRREYRMDKVMGTGLACIGFDFRLGDQKQ